MHRRNLIPVIIVVLILVLSWAGQSPAAQTESGFYLMTNDPDENLVRYFLQDASGEMIQEAAYSTGGEGSGTTEFSFAEPLGSQSSLILSPDKRWLFCVNAGSDQVSVFRAGPDLELTDTVESGGSFPVSLAYSRGLLYVLNAGGEANITGFRLDRSGLLSRIISSTRDLGLTLTDDPPDTSLTPAKIGFSPSGEHLVVTLKQGAEDETASEILIYAMGRDDLPSNAPITITSQADQAYGFAFDLWGNLAVAETEGAVSTYQINAQDGLDLITSSLDNSERGTSWIVRNGPTGKYHYAANSESGTLTGYATDQDGELSLLNKGGVTADVGRSSTRYPAGLAASTDGRFLYVLNRNTRKKAADAAINLFAVEDDGGLDYLDGITGLDQSAQGITAF